MRTAKSSRRKCSSSGFAGRGSRQRSFRHDLPDKTGQGPANPAVCQFVGYKNSGKTTLICALIPLLQARGFSVAVIKHDVHGFETDIPGTDTWRHREAGASAVAITGQGRSNIFEYKSRGLNELIREFQNYDYILVEGFKEEDGAKIVLLRQEEDLGLAGRMTGLLAAALWDSFAEYGLASLKIPLFSVNEPKAIADFLLQQRSLLSKFNI